MSFYITPARRLCIVRACGLFVLAVVLSILPLIYRIDSLGLVFLCILAGLCVIGGVLNLWRAHRTRPKATVTIIPQFAPVREQIRHYRRVFWLSLIALPAATAWVAQDLQIRKPVNNVSVFAPIA